MADAPRRFPPRRIAMNIARLPELLRQAGRDEQQG
jgi:hypothetical protein